MALAADYHIIWDPSVHADGLDFGAVTDMLTADRQGNLFGEGQTVNGVVFALEPRPLPGQWKGKIVFGFTDQDFPRGGLTLMHDTFFGTTFFSTPGFGTAFRIDQPSAPTLTSLHVFLDTNVVPPDGALPQSGLVAGLHGLLYGTTLEGGNGERGTVFAVSQSVPYPAYTIIHRFGRPGDGVGPTESQLAVDGQGRLYGTTNLGGANHAGTVFMLENTGGVWREQVLYSFQTSNDVFKPLANLVLDAQGNLYGCAQGGKAGRGGVFEISPPAQPGGAWSESVIYDFPGGPISPIANGPCGITIDPATNQLFGVTPAGGYYSSLGTIFQLNPPHGTVARWTMQLIHSFDGSPQDGRNPVAPPLKVGATYYGGNAGGTIYEFRPRSASRAFWPDRGSVHYPSRFEGWRR